MVGPQPVWQVTEPDPAVCDELAAETGMSPLAAKILYNRGIRTAKEAQDFLTGTISELHDPFLLKGMKEAVSRIHGAVSAGEKIVVYGDYDVDGITSTALVLESLVLLGGIADFYIPDRIEEGYGLNREALRKLASQGARLVITVDCGISAWEEAEFARSLGLELIITDHHEPPEEIPQALAVINPKQPGCRYPFKDLAGVGVVFKLAQALFAVRGDLAQGSEQDLLDLVTLGSIADMVPLLGENRLLVKHGLPRLTHAKRVGIRSLMDVAGLTGRVIGSGQVGFALAPRINATGRIGDAALAVRLLLTQDALRAREMAVYLDSENQARQEIESGVLAEVLEMLQEFDLEQNKFIVLAREAWHPGVIGIVASRVVEKYYRPVILIALDGEEGKGSGRSIAGFDLYEALHKCSDLFVRFGGHKQAAGITIRADQIEPLRFELNRMAAEAPLEIFTPKLRLDAMVALEEVDSSLVQEIKGLEPFGIGNPGPVLAAVGLKLVERREVGKDKAHLKVKLKGTGLYLDGIGFNLASRSPGCKPGVRVNAAFTPDFNEYNGRVSVQLQLKDITPCTAPEVKEYPEHKDLSSRELQVLEELEQGNNATLVHPAHPLFPVIAAITRSRQTNLPSILVYPFPVVAEKVAVVGADLVARHNLRLIFSQDGADLSRLTAEPGLIVTSAAFLDQDVVRLKAMAKNLALIGVDSMVQSPAALAGLGVSVLYSNSSQALLESYSPSREKLARLYKVLQGLAVRQGDSGFDPSEELQGMLNESRQFIRVGLDIFEELQIIKRENARMGRIIYFQAPEKKLNLSDSRRFREGRALAEEFAKLQQR